MKYVISAHEFDPIVVIGNASHSDLRQVFFGAVGGAGHMRIVDGKVEVFGESIGIGMKAEPRDAEILAAKLGIPTV